MRQDPSISFGQFQVTSLGHTIQLRRNSLRPVHWLTFKEASSHKIMLPFFGVFFQRCLSLQTNLIILIFFCLYTKSNHYNCWWNLIECVLLVVTSFLIIIYRQEWQLDGEFVKCLTPFGLISDVSVVPIFMIRLNLVKEERFIEHTNIRTYISVPIDGS